MIAIYLFLFLAMVGIVVYLACRQALIDGLSCSECEKAAQPQESEWKRAMRFAEEHLERADEDGCSCRLHEILRMGQKVQP